MNTSDLLEGLKKVLSAYEVKCYLSLLERNALTVSEISHLGGIPRASAYEALEKLMAKGMCVELPGSTRRYSATDPSILEEKFILSIDFEKESELKKIHLQEQQVIERIEAQRKRIGSIVNKLKPQYEKSRSNNNPLNYIEVIKDPHQIHTRFMQLVREARREILVFTKPPYSVPREKLREQAGPQVESLKQGILIRGIYETPTEKTDLEWWQQVLKNATGRGEEVRIIDELPLKMGIFDEKTVILALEDPVSRQPAFTTQIIEHSALAKGLKILFNTLWEQAHPHNE